MQKSNPFVLFWCWIFWFSVSFSYGLKVLSLYSSDVEFSSPLLGRYYEFPMAEGRFSVNCCILQSLFVLPNIEPNICAWIVLLYCMSNCLLQKNCSRSNSISKILWHSTLHELCLLDNACCMWMPINRPKLIHVSWGTKV